MSSLICLSFTLKIPSHSSMSSTQIVAASSPCNTYTTSSTWWQELKLPYIGRVKVKSQNCKQYKNGMKMLLLWDFFFYNSALLGVHKMGKFNKRILKYIKIPNGGNEELFLSRKEYSFQNRIWGNQLPIWKINCKPLLRCKRIWYSKLYRLGMTWTYIKLKTSFQSHKLSLPSYSFLFLFHFS